MAFLLRSLRPIANHLSSVSRPRQPVLTSVNNLCRYMSNDRSNDDGNESDKPSLRQKFIPMEEAQPEEILDYHEESFGFKWDEKHQLIEDDLYVYRKKNKATERAKQSEMKRGVTGVFDVEDLVDVLRQEKLNDICVISVPPKYQYCDYLVLATARSPKHLSSVIAYVRKVYKLIKNSSDPHLKATIDSESNWRIIDMNHIVLHLFLPNVRQIYDIESLWCIGADLDEKVLNPEYDEVVTQLEKHIKFLEEMQPLKTEESPAKTDEIRSLP